MDKTDRKMRMIKKDSIFIIQLYRSTSIFFGKKEWINASVSDFKHYKMSLFDSSTRLDFYSLDQANIVYEHLKKDNYIDENLYHFICHNKFIAEDKFEIVRND